MILCHGVNFSSQKQTSRDSLVPPDSAFSSPIHSFLPRCFPHQKVSHTLSCYVDKRNTQVTMHETKYTSYYRKTLSTFISLVNKGYTQVTMSSPKGIHLRYAQVFCLHRGSNNECLHQRPNCTTFSVSNEQINGLSKPY